MYNIFIQRSIHALERKKKKYIYIYIYLKKEEEGDNSSVLNAEAS
jgi:hypothetical protein